MRGIVLDLSQSQGLELGDEFAKTSGVVQQRAQAFRLCWVQRAHNGLAVDLAGPGPIGPVQLRRVGVAAAAGIAAARRCRARGTT